MSGAVTPAEVVAAARAYKDVPFAHQARSLAGMDCAGLSVRVARDIGHPVEDVLGYGRSPRGDALLRHVRSQCVERFGEPEPGMLAVMRFEREAQHVAFIVPHAAGLGMLHAYEPAKRVVEHVLDIKWRRRILALFDLPGVAR